MSEGKVILVLVAVATLAYSSCAAVKKRRLDLEEIVVLAMNMAASVTGAYIFIGAFKVATNSSQNSVWAGITGVCMVIYFSQKIIASFVGIVTCEMPPQNGPNNPGSADPPHA